VRSVQLQLELGTEMLMDSCTRNGHAGCNTKEHRELEAPVSQILVNEMVLISSPNLSL
jgi:hypothetical protein